MKLKRMLCAGLGALMVAILTFTAAPMDAKAAGADSATWMLGQDSSDPSIGTVVNRRGEEFGASRSFDTLNLLNLGSDALTDVISYNNVDHQLTCGAAICFPGTYSFQFENGKYCFTGPDMENVFIPKGSGSTDLVNAVIRGVAEYTGEIGLVNFSFDRALHVGDIVPAGSKLVVAGDLTSESSSDDLYYVYVDGVKDLDRSGNFYAVNTPMRFESITNFNVVIDDGVSLEPGEMRFSTLLTDGEMDSNSKSEEKWYLETLVDEMKKKIDAGETDEFHWTGGHSLPTAVMTLINQGEFDFVFHFTYEGVEHVVRIPAGKAPEPDINIPWYGPLWLLEHYGDELKK